MANCCFLVHPSHAAAAVRHCRFLLLFRKLGYQGFGGQHQGRDGACVLQCRPRDLGRIDDAGLHQVLELIGLRVVAEVLVFRLANSAHNNRALFARVDNDLAQRLFERAAHDVGADPLVAFQVQRLDGVAAAQQRHAAAGNDAFLHRGAGGVHRVLDAGLLLLHLGFGRSTDLDDGNAAHQLRQPLLQLLAVVVAGGLLDLAADFLYPAFDVGVLALSFDDGRVVLVDGDLLGLSEIVHVNVLELDAKIFGDSLAAGQSSDVPKHSLAAISEARSLHGCNLQRATKLVDHQGGQRFAFDVLSDDDQRTPALGDLLEQRKQVLHRRDFLFVDEDQRVLQNHFHALRIGDEVRRQIAAVELHAFDDLELGLHRLGFFHRDHAVFADLLHGLGNDAADGLVVVGRDGANLGDHLAGNLLRELVESGVLAIAVLVHGSAHGSDGLVDAALQRHRVCAGSHRLYALAEDGLRQQGRGGGAVAGNVGSFGRDFTHHLRAHVLERVFQLDFLGYGHAVFGNERRTEFLLDHDIAALGAESDLHGIGQNIHAAKNRLP